MLRLRTKNNPKHKKYEGVSKQAHPHFFDFVEDRLHLGNTKKNEFSFDISLDLRYLCSRILKQAAI